MFLLSRALLPAAWMGAGFEPCDAVPVRAFNQMTCFKLRAYNHNVVRTEKEL